MKRFNEFTEYDTRRVGTGYRRFNGELYSFWYRASFKWDGNSLARDSEKHEAEVKAKAGELKRQGYKVRVVKTRRADYLFYVGGERVRE